MVCGVLYIMCSPRESFERVEAVAAERAVGLEPGIDLRERLRLRRVQPTPTVHADRHEPGLAQHPEVLGDAGLAELEVADKVADGSLALAQQVEDSRRCGSASAA